MTDKRKPKTPAARPKAAKAPRPKAPKRRAADRAESPLHLAAALNEREEFQRRQRGQAPEPVVAAEIVPILPGLESLTRPFGETEAPAPDPMELAVDEALRAMPFRERVRARVGRAELLLFRVGRELFATPLAAVEEAVELEEIRAIPEMPASMLGVTDLRGRMIPIYSPARTLGVDLGAAPAAALVVRSGERRVALAVDDVEDVLDADLTTLREAPGSDDADGVLAGVVRHGRMLVAVLDGEALVAACLSERVPEIA
jgi:purine-binding chemotaxis protein CheW